MISPGVLPAPIIVSGTISMVRRKGASLNNLRLHRPAEEEKFIKRNDDRQGKGVFLCLHRKDGGKKRQIDTIG